MGENPRPARPQSHAEPSIGGAGKVSMIEAEHGSTMEPITITAIAVSALVGVLQRLLQEYWRSPRAPEPARGHVAARPAVDIEQVTTDLAAVARKPDAAAEVQLGAGLAAVAVAQLQPKPESRLKTYVWPLVIAVIGIFAPVVNHVIDSVDPKPVDCAAYVDGVKKLTELAVDEEHLSRLADGTQPDSEIAQRCGGRPLELLRKAGKIR